LVQVLEFAVGTASHSAVWHAGLLQNPTLILDLALN
jgi:hypothetical protein